jgi:uncharacterized protein YjbI with pentapeptide repeats
MCIPGMICVAFSLFLAWYKSMMIVIPDEFTRTSCFAGRIDSYVVGATFQGASLVSASLENCDFEGCQFQLADLTNASLNGSSFRQVDDLAGKSPRCKHCEAS